MLKRTICYYKVRTQAFGHPLRGENCTFVSILSRSFYYTETSKKILCRFVNFAKGKGANFTIRAKIFFSCFCACACREWQKGGSQNDYQKNEEYHRKSNGAILRMAGAYNFNMGQRKRLSNRSMENTSKPSRQHQDGD